MENISAFYNMDCLIGMRTLYDSTVDLVLTDPPYASGGLHATDRKADTRSKYTDDDGNGAAAYENFSGDNMDQRAWFAFMREVLTEARRVAKPQGVAAVFCDWRQLPILSDALQAAGWTWRGVVVWDKRSSRPQKGRFRNQCEYVVWGSNGALPFERGVPPLPGVFTEANVPTQERVHQTQKPLGVITSLMEITPPGSVVLDMFAGSGTTAVAAVRTGRKYICFECEPAIYARAQARLAAESTKEEEAAK